MKFTSSRMDTKEKYARCSWKKFDVLAISEMLCAGRRANACWHGMKQEKELEEKDAMWRRISHREWNTNHWTKPSKEPPMRCEFAAECPAKLIWQRSAHGRVAMPWRLISMFVWSHTALCWVNAFCERVQFVRNPTGSPHSAWAKYYFEKINWHVKMRTFTETCIDQKFWTFVWWVTEYKRRGSTS